MPLSVLQPAPVSTTRRGWRWTKSASAATESGMAGHRSVAACAPAPLLRPGDESLQRHRAGVVIALLQRAAQALQFLRLRGGFHAFGDHVAVEGPRQADDALHD